MAQTDNDSKITRDLVGLREVVWDTIDGIQKKSIGRDRALVIIKGADTIVDTYQPYA